MRYGENLAARLFGRQRLHGRVSDSSSNWLGINKEPRFDFPKPGLRIQSLRHFPHQSSTSKRPLGSAATHNAPVLDTRIVPKSPMVIRIIGHRFRFHHDPERNTSIEIFDRQVRAFGMEIQQVLRAAGSRLVFGLELNAEFRESFHRPRQHTFVASRHDRSLYQFRMVSHDSNELFVAQVPPIYISSICLLVLP